MGDKLADNINKITDDNVNEIRTVFELFDCKNHDGNVTKGEMKKFLNKLGVFPSKMEVDALFNYFDSSGNA